MHSFDVKLPTGEVMPAMADWMMIC